MESDILGDGSLDYPDEILEGFDFVIASVHSGSGHAARKDDGAVLKPPSKIRYTRMMGHPTGRLLLKREESKLDMNRLIELAAEHETVIEINASPWRLDLDWRYGNKAKETGLITSINPDAHTTDGIDDIRYGVMIARKAKFEPARLPAS
jgi:DNA polymerase (family X)